MIRFGQSNYVIPQDKNKQLVYAGFGGIIHSLKVAMKYNNLSTGLYDNLREGRWLLNYYIDRLKRYNNLQEIVDIL
jgi:hypothetical protein